MEFGISFLYWPATRNIIVANDFIRAQFGTENQMRHAMDAKDLLQLDDDRLLSEDEVRIITGISRTTLWRRRREGKWPPLVKIGGKSGNTLGQIRKRVRAAVDEAEERARERLAAE
jgi:predicted DNA-binding transcriptional regulator AlpA